MSAAEEARLRELCGLRDDARGLVLGDVARLKAELARRGVGARIRDKAVVGLADAGEDALAVIGENRVMLGLGGAALTGWLLRKPLFSLGRAAWSRIGPRVEELWRNWRER